MPTIRIAPIQSASQRKSKSKEAMIFIRYSHQSKSTCFFTKKNIALNLWDKRNQRAKRGYVGYNTLNVYLSREQQKVEDIVNTALMEGVNPTVAYVKDCYHGRIKESEKPKPLSFWEFVGRFMETAEKRLTPNTIRSYKTSFKNLKKFERYARIQLDWHNIDMDFYYNYQDYYINYLDLKMNGFGKVLKLLKTVLNEATEQGYNTNKTYKSKNFKVTKENVDNIYLSEAELKMIGNVNLVDNPKLERVRDLFYIGCYTGLRFSDLGEVNYNNIRGNFLHIKTKKTGADVVIPILQEIKPIIERHQGKLPKPYTNQVMNRYLKKLGQLAGIEDDVNTYNNKGTARVKNTFKKWELISTHTARRSFATNMYKRGYDSKMIMMITGHSSEKVFNSYIKVSQEENAKRFLERDSKPKE